MGQPVDGLTFLCELRGLCKDNSNSLTSGLKQRTFVPDAVEEPRITGPIALVCLQVLRHSIEEKET